MNKKKSRSLLSLLLSLAMILALVVTPVQADSTDTTAVAQNGSTTYETLAAAVTAASSGDTITLLQDTELTASLTTNTNLTLDLGNHTITAGSYTISSAKNTDLTVKNGSITGTANGVLTKTTAGSLTLQGVNITCTSSTVSYYALKVGTSGNVINFSATNCSFTGSNKASGVYLSCGKNITDGSQFTLTNCTVSAVSYGVNILGGDSTNKVVISNCDISNTGTSYGALYLSSGVAGTVTVTNTKITSSGTAVFINYGAGAVTLELGEGNTVSGKVNLGQLASSNTVSYTVKVTGGCFSYTVNGVETIPFVDGNTTNSLGITENTTINGGYYKVDVSSLLPTGYECVLNTSGTNTDYTYVVQEESNVGTFYTIGTTTVYYSSLSDAISANAGTVYIRETYTLTDTDLTAIAASSAVISTDTGVTLTYSGTLSDLLSAMGTSASFSGATVACSDITLSDVSTSGGKLTGGAGFTSSNYESYAGLLASGYLFSASSNYVIKSESEFAAKNDQNYLGYDTVQGALNSVYRYSGSTITVLKDVTESLSLVLESDFTLDLNGHTITAGSAGYGFLVVYSTSSNPDGSKITIKNGTIIGTEYGVTTNGTLTNITLTLEDVTISATDSESIAVYLAAGGSTTISGCTITGGTGVQLCGGSLTIQDSETNTTTITATGKDTTATKTGDGGICDGAAISIIERDGYQALGNVTITGGTYTSENTSAVLAYNWSNNTSSTWSSTDCTISITGGTYSSDVNDYTTSTTASVAATAADGSAVYEVVETVTGAVAVVYDKDGKLVGSYTSLKAAYSNVTDGGTMIIVKDVEDEQLGASSDKAVTLDLNGHTISKSSGSVIDCSNGTLTIKDSSQTESAIGTGMVQGTGNVALKLRGGNVVLESGTLESTSTYAVTMSGGTLTVNGGAVIGASSAKCLVYYTGGTLTINDGLFTVVGRDNTAVESGVTSGAIVNVGSSTTNTASDEDGEASAQVTINGGVFQMYRPLLGSGIKLEITGGYFLSKYSIGDYIPTGYGYTSGNTCTYLGVEYSSYYQVAHTNFTLSVTSGSTTTESYYKTLTAAVNAAINAYTKNTNAAIIIKMENDYETGKVPVESAVAFTLDLNGYTLTSTDKGAFKITNSGVTVTITDSSEDGTGTITTVDSSTATASTTGLFQVTSGTLNITDGNFNQNAADSLVAGSGTVSITGGCFTSDPSEYVATDYVSAKITDDTYTYTVLSVVLGASSDSSTSVFATAIDGYGTNTLYVGVSASDISKYSTTNYPTTSLTYTSDSSVDSGSYIFAGWYSAAISEDSTTTYTAMTSFPTGAAYAKFVDANALSVQCLFTYNVSGMGNIWRFFTSINSQDMDGVIFKITDTDGNELATTTKATHAYTKYTITGTNPSTVFTPDLFSSVSSYILTGYYADSNINLSTCNVKACWITLDGTTVEGSSCQFTHSSATGKLEPVE